MAPDLIDSLTEGASALGGGKAAAPIQGGGGERPDLMPPLGITRKGLDRALDIVDACLAEVEADTRLEEPEWPRSGR